MIILLKAAGQIHQFHLLRTLMGLSYHLSFGLNIPCAKIRGAPFATTSDDLSPSFHPGNSSCVGILVVAYIFAMRAYQKRVS
jgi:hypothetical protein